MASHNYLIGKTQPLIYQVFRGTFTFDFFGFRERLADLIKCERMVEKYSKGRIQYFSTGRRLAKNESVLSSSIIFSVRLYTCKICKGKHYCSTLTIGCSPLSANLTS